MNNLSPYKGSPCKILYQHGNFKVSDKVLGEGGTGVVSRAFAVHTDSPLAVKTLFEDVVQKAEVAGLQYEIPHATRHRGDFERDDEFHVVMDEAAGKTADTASLSLSEIRALASQQFEILEDLEDKSLINYDIKPSNIIWNKASNSLTVIDLASMRSLDETYDDEPGITIEYLPPEAILGKEADTSYNIWSSACMLFELIVGEKLFSMLHSDPQEADFIFFQIVEQIGLPTKAYVDTCERGYLLFDEDLKMKPRWTLPSVEHWKVRLEKALIEKGATQEQVTQWQNLLSSMLCYEDRISPQELKKSPIRPDETHARLLYDRTNKCTLEITRASKESKSPDLVIDLKKEKNCCLHIPKDPDDQYKILVKNSTKQTSATVALKQDDRLDLYPYQQEIATKRKLF